MAFYCLAFTSFFFNFSKEKSSESSIKLRNEAAGPMVLSSEIKPPGDQVR